MRVIKLYEICPSAEKAGIANTEVSCVVSDTRMVQKNCLFVCIKGERFDSHEKAAEMLEKGAAAVITQRDLSLEGQIICDNSRLELAKAISRFYGSPEKKLKLIAVTGTNGKTTTAALVKGIITGLGHKCAIIGTTGTDTGKKHYDSFHGTPTTPPPEKLFPLFAEMADNGAEYCVMEVSSQALAQYRTGDTRFAAAGFTNLTRDHLDYHKTMEAYYKAKRSLFEYSDAAVICIDDEYGKRLAGEPWRAAVTVGLDRGADIRADMIKTSVNGSSFILTDERHKKAYPAFIGAPGLYNVQNALCAAALVNAAGFDMGDIVNALKDCEGAKGRLSVIYSGAFTVISDYAHTDDALDKMLSAVKADTRGRLICVFGAAGDRDKEKRPLMGKAVSEYADYMIISSDNPAHEDPDDIIAQVCEGIDKSIPHERIADRAAAIRRALSIAESGDVVVLAGKGHETYQIIGDEYLPFSEEETVREYMKDSDS